MTPEEAQERKALSHSLWALSQQIATLAAIVLEPVRRGNVGKWNGKAPLTDDEIFAGCADPRTWQPEQECVSG